MIKSQKEIENLNEKKETNSESSKRKDYLSIIEKEIQKKWEENKTFECTHERGWESKSSWEDKNKTKYLATFPYAYMNGKLHLGHIYSMTKGEVMVRFQRLMGKNAMFPYAFHCTGMPIAAAANKVKREVEGENLGSISQIKILKSLDVPDELIPKFANPTTWLEYFPPLAQQDLKNLGMAIDWSRTFITTDRHRYYDKFVEWNFLKLKKEGKIKFGKHPTIYSALLNQPIADHDRSKGEGVSPQEFTLIKMELREKIPNSILQIVKDKKVFLVAATLRPETVYGQTNCFVHPEGNYDLIEMQNEEFFICSSHSAKNMAYQGLTKLDKKAESLATIRGYELIGTKVHAPFSFYPEVPVLPMVSILMDKGTGIVTSVPSDSPDDWIAVCDCRKENSKKKYALSEELLKFEPVKIIDIPEYGSLTAVTLVEKLKINSQNDRVKLDEAKKISYTKGFYEGTFLVEPYKGMKVHEVKEKVVKDLLEKGLGLTYYEPEDEVVSRSGDVCVVSLVDQWMINYGETQWKQKVKSHVESVLETYNSALKNAFLEGVDWLKEWGCSRTFGVGSYIPWDKKYLIESLSDSTIYMAYYTISNYLSRDLYGDQSYCGIQPEDLSEDVLDYIFLESPMPEVSKIPQDLLKEMKESFNYWYPMDFRCSGKDLIKNHLLMCLYNHAAIWKDEKFMPKSIFCNGYVLVDGQKMSKNLGNFYTIADLIKKYGADASKIALCDAGDTLDDANFSTKTADASVHRIFIFSNFVEKFFADHKLSSTYVNKDELVSIYDKVFFSQIHYLSHQTKGHYEKMKFRNVIKDAFYGMLSAKDEYINNVPETEWNIPLIGKFIETFLLICSPIIPHVTDYLYTRFFNPIFETFGPKEKVYKSLFFASFPKFEEPFQFHLIKGHSYVKDLIQNVKNYLKKKESDISKENKSKINIRITLYNKNNEDFKIVEKILRSNEGISFKEFSQVIATQNSHNMQLAAFIFRQFELYGYDIFTEDFEEIKFVNNHKDYFQRAFSDVDIEFIPLQPFEKLKNLQPDKPLISLKY
jgi:leucyl-tRNA synthetase